MQVQMVQSFLLLITHLKCRTVLSIRKVKNLKHKEVVLPENINNKKTRYHPEYYRKFNALERNVPLKKDDVESKSVHARLKSTLASGSSSTGIMPEICIVCIKKDEKHNGGNQKLILVEKRDFEEKIKKYATTPEDQALSSNLGSVNFVAKETRYHGICKTKYQTAAEQVSKTSQNKKVAKCSTNLWHRRREIHSDAFKSICSLVEDQSNTSGNVLGLKESFSNYVSILEDLDVENVVASYTVQKLKEKLKLRFKECIIIHEKKYKRGGPLIYNSNITFEASWSSKIKTGSTCQRYCLHFESYHRKRDLCTSPFKWNQVWWHYRWRSSNSRAINSITHSPCCWFRS